LYFEKSGIAVVLLFPEPLNGESKELVSRFEAEVESARTGREASEDRGSLCSSVREVWVREAIAVEVVVVVN
jgi:hypothetical protein